VRLAEVDAQARWPKEQAQTADPADRPSPRE